MRKKIKFKFIAFLSALFLGWVGVHKFYLEQTSQGILYFLFFVFGFGLVTLTAAIIDSIKYLLMSNDEFNRLYNPGEIFITPEEKLSVRLSYLISGATPNPLNLNQINQNEQSMNGMAHDRILTLRELKSLYDDGIITASEYEQKRKKLLDLM